jgi:hypothetical protein
VLDLAPREGATVLALAKHHPYRTIYYLQPASDHAVQLDHNLHTYPEAAGRMAPLRSSSELHATAPCGLYERSSWQTLANEFRNVFREAVVLRMHVGATCWKDAVSALEDFPRCRLLLLECDDQPQDYFGLLLAELADRHFVPRLDLLTFSSLPQPGLLSRKHILTLPLTRSGLSISASEV